MLAYVHACSADLFLILELDIHSYGSIIRVNMFNAILITMYTLNDSLL